MKSSPVNLEQGTQAFINELEASKAPPIYTLTPQQARNVLEKVQSSPIDKPQVSTEERTIPGGSIGPISIKIIRPANSKETLPIILYIHGAGWVMGSALTHDYLVRKLSIGSGAAVVFVNYDLSPEARFPTAIEQSYATLLYIHEHAKSLHLDGSRIAISGDSVGGNMSIALTMLNKERKGPKLCCQALFYPVTNAELTSGSYEQFANGPWLTKPAMEWFWNAYEPDVSARKNPHLSPLKAPTEQLKGLPPALIITAENDVLRDEGEGYAHKLMQSGVTVTSMRMLGTIHDFMMLHALAKTPAAKEAISVASAYLTQAFKH